MNLLRHTLRSVLVISLGLFACGCSGGAAADAQKAAQSGDYKRAIELYTELARSSSDPAVFCNRGNCYSSLGDFDAAFADYQTAFDKINARTPAGNDHLLPYLFFNRGLAYERAKKYDLAVQDYEKTIAAKDDYPDVKNNLAWLLATCPDAQIRNPQRAVQLAERELKSRPEIPEVLDTVAACYAAAGDFPRATSTQEKAIALCGDSAKASFNARLALYRNKQPYVEPEAGN